MPFALVMAAERHGSLSSIQRIKIQVSGIEVRGPYLSETNVFSPENGWLEDTNIVSFWEGSTWQVLLLLVSGSVYTSDLPPHPVIVGKERDSYGFATRNAIFVDDCILAWGVDPTYINLHAYSIPQPYGLVHIGAPSKWCAQNVFKRAGARVFAFRFFWNLEKGGKSQSGKNQR